MIPAPIPAEEAERLADLAAVGLLDTPPEERYDRLVSLAARILDVPIAYVALIDSDRQWFKAKCGLTTDETGRDVSFCGHAILQREPLIVPDARVDERFRDNPLVTGEPFLRFYCGFPLAGPTGRNVGTFCVGSPEPRSLTDRETEILSQLALLAEHELNMVELIEIQQQLLDARRTLARELDEASRYVQSLLPSPLRGEIRTDWRFVSSSQLGGDLFGYHRLPDNRFALYLLDVCGHGVGASLLSVSVHQTLRSQSLRDVRFEDPADVFRGLNLAYPMESNQERFFTIWYGVFDPDTRLLRYGSAGHHAALLFEPDTEAPLRLGSPNLMIGVAPNLEFVIREQRISPGARLYVFSDGVFEIPIEEGGLLGFDELARMMGEVRNSGESRVEAIQAEVERRCAAERFPDDFSIVEFEFD